MIDNGLDISLQCGFLYIGDMKQPLTLENYFYVYNWSSDSIPYELYTEDKLRKIHRAFGHPSVSATHKLLRRASKEPLKIGTRNKLQQLVHD